MNASSDSPSGRRTRTHAARSSFAVATWLVAGATCCLAAGFATGCNKPAQAKNEEAAAPVHVETGEVTEIDAPVVLRLTGTLRGMKEADLAASAAGRVIRTGVERGDEVKEGAVVAQLDTSAATLSLLEAQVQVATSRTQEDINKADCARFEQLKAKGAVSALEYDQSTAKCRTAPLGLEAAQARQKIAAKNVGDGTIRAPFAGIVSERYVDVGEYVQPSSKVISIAQVGELRLELTVPEASLAQVKVGAETSFTVAAYPDKTFRGSIRYVAGSVRATTRDLVAEAVVKNDDRLLRPGMFADVALAVGTEKLPSVPLAAVFERQNKQRVFVVAGGRLEERVVQPGAETDGRLSVRYGVKTGEKVAVGKLEGLLNGSRVE
jgi:membrane fusion protein, multidrug efflux system